MSLLSAIGVGLVIIVATRFINSLSSGIPILEFMLLIAGLQWIIGPIIEYHSTYHHYKYYMYVEENVYMGYVVPAYGLFAFLIVLLLKKAPKINFSVNYLSQYVVYAKYILLVGIFFDLAGSFAPGGLKFVFFLLANLKYTAAIILLFSVKKLDRYLFYGSLAYLLLSSIRSGFFHDFLLWGVFFYMFWAYKVKPSRKLNVIIIVTGMFVATLIQGVKAEYRLIIADGYDGNLISLFFDSITQRLSKEEDVTGLEDDENINVRLNQGWIISAIMEHTPRMEPFAGGLTIKEAVFASALPRFLNPDKKIAGGVENFERYTGLPLGENTSMGLSIVGEAYANFGVVGGVVFMMIWALFLVKFWYFLLKRVENRPLFIFFLPLIFLQVIKAETELVVVLNHLVKSLLLVFLFFWGTRKFIYKTFGDENESVLH